MTAPFASTGPAAWRLPSGGPTWVVILALLAVTALPRIEMARRRPVLCTDAVFFLERARAFQAGDGAGGLDQLGLNLYPLVLAGWGQLGCDLELAGRWWSLAMATLVVLPLWGWTRRMLGDAAGLAAGVLYAAHPELIEWSPEIIRDPQFWLALVTSLYCGWRATHDGRWPWYLAAGGAAAAAALTRFEGWFVWVPLTLWTGIALRHHPDERRQLLGSWAVSLALVPLSTLALNVVALPGDVPWQWGREAPARMAVNWLGGWRAAPAQAEPGAESSLAAAPAVAITDQRLGSAEPSRRRITEARAPRPSGWRERFWGLRHTAWRGFHPLYLALAGLGWVAVRWPDSRWRTAWLGIDGFGLLVLGAMWVYLADRGEINKRYVLPAVLVAVPYSAAGAFALWRAGVGLVGTAHSRWPRASGPHAALGPRTTGIAWGLLLAGALLTLGWRTAAESRYASRFRKAELGTWLRLEYGPGRTLLVSEDLERLVGHYAEAERRALPDEVRGAAAAEWLARHRPELVVLRQDRDWPAAYAQLEAAAGGEYQAVDPGRLPPSCRNLRVLVSVSWLAAHERSGRDWRQAARPAARR